MIEATIYRTIIGCFAGGGRRRGRWNGRRKGGSRRRRRRRRRRSWELSERTMAAFFKIILCLMCLQPLYKYSWEGSKWKEKYLLSGISTASYNALYDKTSKINSDAYMLQRLGMQDVSQWVITRKQINQLQHAKEGNREQNLNAMHWNAGGAFLTLYHTTCSGSPYTCVGGKFGPQVRSPVSWCSGVTWSTQESPGGRGRSCTALYCTVLQPYCTVLYCNVMYLQAVSRPV